MVTLESVIQELHGAVSDVMVDDACRVLSSASIADVAELMGKRDLRRIVVVDAEEHVVGVVSERDILKHFLYPETPAENGLEEGEEPARSPAISTLLTGEPITVPATLPLIKAAIVLATHRVPCLPVVSQWQKLIGLLTISDILKHLTGQAEQSLETGFQFYAPITDSPAKMPAYIRRTNRELVVPLKAIENQDAIKDYALLGYDPSRGRILVKFVDKISDNEATMPIKCDKENLVIAAGGFVARFNLVCKSGKGSAYEVSCPEDRRYLVLTPKQGG